MSHQTMDKNVPAIFTKAAAREMLKSWQIDGWFIIIDLALLITALLAAFTEAVVLFFHVIFILLTLGAFFWKFRPFILRAIFWLPVTSGIVLVAVLSNQTQKSELIEIPLLTIILIVVYFISYQRSEAQEELRRSEERYHTLFDNLFKVSRDAIFITNQQGQIRTVNQAMLDLFEYTHDEIIGLDYQKTYIMAKDWDTFQWEIHQKGAVIDYETKLRRKDGTEVDCLLTASVWRSSDEKIWGYQGIIRDITKRKQAEAGLRESEERYRRLVELSFEAIAVHSEGKIIHLNIPGAKLLGAATPEELIGKPVLDFVHPDYLDMVQARVEQAITEGKGLPLVEEKFIRLDGISLDVEAASVPVTYQGQPAIQTVVRDITARKRAEAERERLLVTEHEQRLLAETLGEVFLTLTAQTSYETVLDELLRQVQRIVSYGAANIMLLKKGNTLRVARHQGYHLFSSREVMTNLRQTLIDLPLDAEVVQSRQPLVVPDTLHNPHWVTTPESSWIRSFIAVPICLRDRVLGLLRLDSDIPGKFSIQDLKRLQPLANAAAIALDNARLYDQARQEIAEQTYQAEAEIIQLNQKLLTLQYASATIASSVRLQSVLNTVPKEMASLLKVNGCCILEWNQAVNTVSLTAQYGFDHYWKEESSVQTFSLTEYPLMNRVVTERIQQQITSSNGGIHPAELAYMQSFNLKTLLLAPMEFQNQVVGLVNIMDDQVERIFTNREIGLIQILANQVASAIENNRLYGQIRQVAAKNQAILDAISDSMFYLNRQGELLDYKVISSDNLPAEILHQIRVGKYLNDILPPDLVALTLRSLNEAFETHQMQVFEFELPLSPAPRYFEVRLVVSGPNEALAIVRDITERKEQEATLEKERLRIARDLHDSLGQSLGYLHLKLDEFATHDSLPEPKYTRRELEQMRDVANEAYELVRSMLAAARSSNSVDLATALLAQAKLAGNRARFKVQLTTEGQPRILSPIAQHQILYIFQEALSNVVKHANAQQVELCLVWAEEMLTITLIDNGYGFDTNTPRMEGHFGLIIMQERAEEINSFLSITSKPGAGTELMLRLPLQGLPQPLAGRM